MALYGTFNYGEEEYGSGGGGGGSPSVLDERIPWHFQAIDSDDIYEFAINPLDCSIPSLSKTISTQNTTAGALVWFEGRNKVPVMSFSGTILTETHYEAMREWKAIAKQILVVDDLGRNYWIFIKDFNPSRQYTPQYPWRHEFSVEASVLDWN